MAEPWTFEGESASLLGQGGRLTLVEGSSFAISDRSGDMFAGSAQGFFFRDTRFISQLQLRVNGHAPEPLAGSSSEPYSASIVARLQPRPGRADSTLVVLRHRYIGRGMREDVTIRNFGDEAAYCSVELSYDADFADLFDVKEGRGRSAPGEHSMEHDGTDLVFRLRHGSRHRGVRISLTPVPQLDGNLATYEVIIPARGEWSLCQQFTCTIEKDEIEPRWRCGQPVARATPAQRMAQWRRSVPALDTDHEGLKTLVTRGAEDLGALRIFDPDYPERTVVAAGAPWFMTLFGRDSLLASWMALLIDPDLALGVVQTLARFQGEDVNPHNEEEPGRILHEMRFGDAPSLSLGGGQVYYGSADSTPLFVMLLGELRRWGLATEVVDQLLPHVDRAIDWIQHFGDRDGDGYVEYQRASDRGLYNQGWKDSGDGIRYASGDIPRTPIALCEVQGYVYAAYLARAYFAGEQGDQARSAELRQRATDLKTAFNRDFWLEDRDWLAVGLDRDKKPIDSLTSNMGHCLWTGILDADKAEVVARRLMSRDMFTGWGVRTLAASMVGYNPISYHCGSVWPHDNAIVAAGLMRYGFVTEAQKLILAMIDAGMRQGGRLPELFSGLDRLELPMVVSYPTSCSPQAWAAASPLLMLRTLLRFDPWVPRGKIWLRPALPEQVGRLRLDRIPLAGSRVSVEAEGDQLKIEGIPEWLELVDAPRHPLTGAW